MLVSLFSCKKIRVLDISLRLNFLTHPLVAGPLPLLGGKVDQELEGILFDRSRRPLARAVFCIALQHSANFPPRCNFPLRSENG